MLLLMFGLCGVVLLAFVVLVGGALCLFVGDFVGLICIVAFIWCL